MKLDHEKRPSSMVRLHGSWCKPAFMYDSYTDIGTFKHLGAIIIKKLPYFVLGFVGK